MKLKAFFENLVLNMKKENPEMNFSLLKTDIISIYSRYLSQCKRVARHHYNQFASLKSILKNKSVQLVRMDKGRGSVLMKKADYISKLKSIVDDRNKFKIIPWNGQVKNHPVVRMETKMQNLIRVNLKKRVSSSAYTVSYTHLTLPTILLV